MVLNVRTACLALATAWTMAHAYAVAQTTVAPVAVGAEPALFAVEITTGPKWARAMMDEDLSIQAHVFQYQLHPFYVFYGGTVASKPWR